MYQGRLIFTQLMDHLPRHTFRRVVTRYGGNRRVRTFTCWDQFACMAFAQMTFRESLRDIEACLRALSHRLYHMGIRGRVSRSTLADANEKRDWRIYADFGQVLIGKARSLYVDEPLAVDLDQTVYALDSTMIDLCLSLFPWSRLWQTRTRGAAKLHTLLDLRGPIPTYAWVTPGRVHDARILDLLVPEPGAIYVFDRGYFHAARLFELDRLKATFVVRARKNLVFRRIYSLPVDRSTGLVCDQVVRLTGVHTRSDYSKKVRRVRFKDPETGKSIVVLTNDFSLPALTVAELYRCRWQIELFFKWVKQHLRIKSFYGTSENAVKTQMWTAITVYVLIAIIKKRLQIHLDLYTILQILSVHVFDQVPLPQLFSESGYGTGTIPDRNQLQLFNL